MAMMFGTLMLLAAAQVGPSIGDHFAHAMEGTDPVHIIMLPPKIPDCRTDAEIQRARAEKANGDPQSCDPPKEARPAQGRWR
ncbi:MAG TPA: hypothetical protein VF067_04985 [Sphingomicrobium sp.]